MNIVILIRLENCSLPKSWKLAAYDAKTKQINFHGNSAKNEASAAQQNEMQWNFLFQYLANIFVQTVFKFTLLHPFIPSIYCYVNNYKLSFNDFQVKDLMNNEQI